MRGTSRWARSEMAEGDDKVNNAPGNHYKTLRKSLGTFSGQGRDRSFETRASLFSYPLSLTPQPHVEFIRSTSTHSGSFLCSFHERLFCFRSIVTRTTVISDKQVLLSGVQDSGVLLTRVCAASKHELIKLGGLSSCAIVSYMWSRGGLICGLSVNDR